MLVGERRDTIVWSIKKVRILSPVLTVLFRMVSLAGPASMVRNVFNKVEYLVLLSDAFYKLCVNAKLF